MFLLFILHHILNAHWHRNLLKGRYHSLRVLTLCIDCLVLISMLAEIYSGIVMSRHVFYFLPTTGGMTLARRLHILGAYWGFILMSLHLGLHWNMILGISRKAAGIENHSKIRNFILFAAGLALSGYGIWVFISRNLAAYLLLKSEFVFLDYGEPKILFYLDYLALMGLCIFIAHYGTKIIKRPRGKRRCYHGISDLK